MLLRETRPGDLDGVIGLEESEDTHDWLGTTGRAWHETALADTDQWHLVFLKGHPSRDSGEGGSEEIVGFVVLAGLSRPGPVEMRRMVISAVQRGKGYGRQLLGEVFRLIDSIPDRDRIWLEVSHGNARAQDLYASVGFEPCSPPEGVEAKDDLLYMDYEL